MKIANTERRARIVRYEPTEHERRHIVYDTKEVFRLNVPPGRRVGSSPAEGSADGDLHLADRIYHGPSRQLASSLPSKSNDPAIDVSPHRYVGSDWLQFQSAAPPTAHVDQRQSMPNAEDLPALRPFSSPESRCSRSVVVTQTLGTDRDIGIICHDPNPSPPES